MFRIPLYLILMIAAHSMNAQVDSLHRNIGSLSFSVGFAHTRTIDEGLSYNKLIFQGNGLPLSIEYANTNAHRRTRASFKFIQSQLTSISGKIPADLLQATLLVDHVRFISRYHFLQKQNNLMVGLKLSTDINYYECEDLDNEDVLTINAVHVQFVNHINLSRSKRITIELAMPTVGLSKRLVLDGGLHEPGKQNSSVTDILFKGSKFGFANTYLFDITYQQSLSRLIRWTTIYQFSYLKNNLVEPIRLYRNELRTGFTFNFR